MRQFHGVRPRYPILTWEQLYGPGAPIPTVALVKTAVRAMVTVDHSGEDGLRRVEAIVRVIRTGKMDVALAKRHKGGK